MLKKLKSLFIVEDETGTNISQKKVVQKEYIAPSTKKKIQHVPVNDNVKATDKFVNSLLQAIESNNQEGFDYLEFKQSLQSLKKMEMTDETRFNSAYAMAKTMGASKANLLNSAKHYLTVLDGEKNKFLLAYEKQQEKHVHTRQSKIDNIESGIEKKKAQIKKLTEEIKTLEKEFEQKKTELENAAKKVNHARDQFYAAHKKVSNQITLDIDRINKFLIQ